MTGLARVRVAGFTKAVRRRASRGSRIPVVALSVLGREGGTVEILAHWETRNPDPGEAWERADEVTWRALLELGERECTVETTIDN